MRFPWYSVILLSSAVFFTVLWLGSRDKDFVTPPTSERLSEELANWRLKHPPLPPKPVHVRLPSKPISYPTSFQSIPLPEALETRPSLSAFRDSQNLRPESLTDFAIRLEKAGAHELSLLAWERILDTADASPDQAATARQAIRILRPSLPLWNADSSSNREIILHIHTPEEWKATLSSLLSQLSDDIREASGYQLHPQLMLKTVSQRQGFPTPPVRIWLSNTNEAQSGTPQVTFAPKIPAKSQAPREQLEEQLYLALYRSISGKIDQTDQVMPLSHLAPQDSARDALTSYITRFHWFKLAEAMALTTPPPPQLRLLSTKIPRSNFTVILRQF